MYAVREDDLLLWVGRWCRFPTLQGSISKMGKNMGSGLRFCDSQNILAGILIPRAGLRFMSRNLYRLSVEDLLISTTNSAMQKVLR
jgi:hypothetical protein